MCILFVYTNPNPRAGGYRLVVASNRDEFYKRPAKQAFHCPETGIIGGRDMEPGREGGMWLGVSLKSSTIKFATLLSVTGEGRSDGLGRGPLVFEYLKTEESASDYVKGLESEKFSPFNLFMLEVNREQSISYHHSNSPKATVEYADFQILGFGNSTPDVPFTKVKVGKRRFEDIIENTQTRDDLIEKLLELLKCKENHLPDAELQRRAPGREFLSSIFVRTESVVYGTRTHSLVLVDEHWNVEFIEHTLRAPIDPKNPEWDVSVIKNQL